MEMLLIATKIQGIVKSHGVHASGYLVLRKRTACQLHASLIGRL